MGVNAELKILIAIFYRYTGKILKVINMGSYNYLGYAENEGPRIEAVQEDITKGGVGLSAAPNELGMCCHFGDWKFGNNESLYSTQEPMTDLSTSKRRLLSFLAWRTVWWLAWALPPMLSACPVSLDPAVW